MKIEIKTTQQIKDYNPVRPQSFDAEIAFKTQKWVAVTDVLEAIHKIRELSMDANDLVDALNKE